MLNVAVVGAGYIGLAHIAAYKQIDNAQVVAVIDTNSEKGQEGAKEAGSKSYTSLKDALDNEKIDLVDICLPTVLHEEFTIEAANAKCHVLCEKPVTFTLESYDRMIKACEDNDVYFMVGQVARFWPEFMIIKDYVEKDELGDIHMIYEKRLSRHPNWSDWHTNPEISGGGLYDMNIHDIDYLYSLFGTPEQLYATGWQSPSGCWNHVSTNLTWDNGTQAIVETSLEMTGEFPFSIEFRGTGDKGTIHYSMRGGRNIKDEASASFYFFPEGEESQELEAEQTDMFVTEISSYVNAIENGTEAPITPTESRDVLKITLAIKDSLETGEVVKL
ncbi:MAG: Gfo/Idh/MocA family oxidoreductase [Clostridiaceae bacterium]|nr:Gfo/Idh/MocA family oxidoreductase [Clostridiaceae bacterium]